MLMQILVRTLDQHAQDEISDPHLKPFQICFDFPEAELQEDANPPSQMIQYEVKI